MKNLSLVVLAVSGPSLEGSHWLRSPGFHWRPEFQMNRVKEEALKAVSGDCGEVCKDKGGRVPPTKMYVDKGAMPSFFSKSGLSNMV